jgi:DNA mismatch endonuclease (patch repair protein)
MDTVSQAVRSRIMASVRTKNTGPELLLRKALHRLGLRFRLHARGLPGSPDIVFPKFKAVVFVHGCFWHAHGCRLSTVPSTRIRFWKDKFLANTHRDRRNAAMLASAGWRVATVWQCALKPRQNVSSAIAGRIERWLAGGRKRLEIPASLSTPAPRRPRPTMVPNRNTKG